MKTIDEAKSYLENLPQLEEGATRLCPRCGINSISALLSETALSRRADVNICPSAAHTKLLRIIPKCPRYH